jgi:hypothetical protein
MTEKDIISAYCKIRTIDQTIPDEVLDFMKEAAIEKLVKADQDDANWIPYSFNILASRPKVSGKYFVCRKDGKVHWETWNGSGWAYNEASIKYWKDIKMPTNFKH